MMFTVPGECRTARGGWSVWEKPELGCNATMPFYLRHLSICCRFTAATQEPRVRQGLCQVVPQLCSRPLPGWASPVTCPVSLGSSGQARPQSSHLCGGASNPGSNDWAWRGCAIQELALQGSWEV